MRREMRTGLQAGAVLLLVFVLAACGGGNAGVIESAEPAPEGFKTYTDDTHDIYAYYPEDWTVKEINETTFGFVSPKVNGEDPFMENVGIQIINLSGQSITLEEYAQLLIDQAKSEIADFELLSSETVPGEGDHVDTHFLEYDGSLNGIPMAYDTTLIIDGDRGFILTYTAERDKFDQYIDAANQIMDSFTF